MAREEDFEQLAVPDSSKFKLYLTNGTVRYVGHAHPDSVLYDSHGYGAFLIVFNHKDPGKNSVKYYPSLKSAPQPKAVRLGRDATLADILAIVNKLYVKYRVGYALERDPNPLPLTIQGKE